MAVEDGATLGMLLNKYSADEMATNQSERNQQITRLLQFYEDVRKSRAEVIVAGATDTRHYYHLADGPEQSMRDEELAKLADDGWDGPCSFNWGDAVYQRELLAFDVGSRIADKMASWGGLNMGMSRRRSCKDPMQKLISSTLSTKI